MEEEKKSSEEQNTEKKSDCGTETPRKNVTYLRRSNEKDGVRLLVIKRK